MWEEFVSIFILPYQHESENVFMSHIQEAYWFYCDHLFTGRVTFRRFVHLVGERLRWRPESVGQRLKTFWKWCAVLPRCGGALINKQGDKVLLVRGHRSKRWTFPAGKKWPQELAVHCAVREVFEETGYYSQPSEFRFSYKHRKASYHIFLFLNVPEDFRFAPQTKQEIDEIKWVPHKHIAFWMTNRKSSQAFQRCWNSLLGCRTLLQTPKPNLNLASRVTERKENTCL